MSRLSKLLGLLVALRAARRAVIDRRQPPPAPEPDFDPRKRLVPSNRRAETAVAVLLMLAALFGLGFTAVYVVLDANTQLLGVAMGGALILLAAAAIVAGKLVVPQETAVEERGALLDEQQTESVVEIIEAGGEGISRRVLLIGAGGVAGAAMVTAAATPLASLGPTLNALHQTPWARGTRLVDDQGTPYRADDIQIGAFYTALPEHSDPEAFGAGLLVVRLPPTSSTSPPRAVPGRRPGSSRTRRSALTPAARSRCIATPRTRRPASSRRSPARATTRHSCPGRGAGWSSARPVAHFPSCR